MTKIKNRKVNKSSTSVIATQIGLTATPKETVDVSTTHYFGDAVYTYSPPRLCARTAIPARHA